MTRAEAIQLFESRFWETMSDRDRAMFQLHESKLCMPFGVFHAAVEKALGRPVWTHEFAFPEALRRELLGEKPAPTMEQILALIPADKLIVVSYDAD